VGEEHSEQTTVSAEAARELIAGSNGRVLDIRSDEAWTTVGNIPGAVRGSSDDPVEAAKAIDDDTQVVVVCTDGQRSAEVAEKLREEGRDAVSIDGGMESWVEEDYALQPTQDPDPPGDGDDADSAEAEGGGADADDESDAPADPSGENR